MPPNAQSALPPLPQEEFEELDPETKAAMCFFANTRLRAGLIVGAANVWPFRPFSVSL